MSYKGEIIEESLSDKGILKRFMILSTRTEAVTARHRTPWIRQWTLHLVEVTDAEAEELAGLLSRSLDQGHGGSWYVDYKNENTHYIIFPGKVFRVNRRKPGEYAKAREYGISIGIPEYQLDFSPGVR